MSTLRAAVIGLGVGEQHIAGFAAHPECEVVAICDTDPEKLAAVAARHPGITAVADPAAVLADPHVDVVSVASYDQYHFEQITSAFAHGKHVFAEKPLVLDENEARELRATLRATPALRLSSNVPLRMSPRFEELRTRIAAGDLGEIFHVEGDYDYGRRHKLTDGWRGREPHYSIVLGGAIHVVDLVLWMTGLRAVEVTSALGSGIATRGTAFRHDDFVLATLRLEGGATMKVTANLGCVSPHFHGVRIYGTSGTFHNGLPDGVLHLPAAPPAEAVSTAVTSAYPGVHKGALIHSFVSSILTGEPARVTEDDVFGTLAVCFAIERALRSGGAEPVLPLG